MNNPTFLLLMTGTLLGINFPLGKIAGNVGISPIIWAMIISLGVCTSLLPVLIVKKEFILPKGQTIRYVMISSIISFVLPNILLFSVIPHAGSGYTGLMFALSPVFTLTLATLFHFKPPSKIGVLGIALGLIGAIIVSITRSTSPEAPPIIWVIAALMIPVALACGNIYRSLDWPPKANPEILAFWSHTFALIIYATLLWIKNGTIPLNEFTLAPFPALAQALIAGATFPFYFRLQKAGGPVLLSQIGYVAAAIGLLTATFLLGEHYSLMTWMGAGVIGSGIIMTITAQSRVRA